MVLIGDRLPCFHAHVITFAYLHAQTTKSVIVNKSRHASLTVFVIRQVRKLCFCCIFVEAFHLVDLDVPPY